jgi:ankyrin repeat protein
MDPAATLLQLVIEGKDRELAGKDRELSAKDRELALTREQHALALQLRDAREAAEGARRDAEAAALRREAEGARRELEALLSAASSAQSALVQGALAAALLEERARLAREETAARFRRDQRALWLRSTDGLAAVLTLVAQCGFNLGAAPSACRALRGDTALWDVIKDVQNGKTGWTRLYYASKMGDLARVHFLLDRGADVNARACFNFTSLLFAAAYGRATAQVLGALLAKGADVNACDDSGAATLSHACFFGNIESVQLLLNSGAKVNSADRNGETALGCAAFKGCLELVQELIARGATVDHAALNGKTPLMKAAIRGHNEVARVLLAHGASKTAVDDKGMTAYARAKGSSAELRALLKP